MNEDKVKKLVEEYLVRSGWVLKNGFELGKDNSDFIIRNEFFNRIKDINKNLELTERDIEEVLFHLMNASWEETLSYLKNGIAIYLNRSNINYKELIKLIDFDNIENNSFILGREVIFKKADKKIIADHVLFVNGVPLVIIEEQSTDVGEYERAAMQLFNYGRNLTGLFKIAQIGLIVADNIYYFPFDKNKFEDFDELLNSLCIWKPDEDRRTKDWNKVLSSTLDVFFNKKIFLEILKYFTFYMGDGRKIIPRYYQYYTVTKLYKGFSKRLNGKSKKRSWTVWHYQGTGKSVEMIYISNLILKKLKKAKSPLILLVLDRTELQDQLINKFFKQIQEELGYETKIIASFKELVNSVLHSGKRVKPGVYAILIQKFRSSSKKFLQKINFSFDVLKNKKDVFILIDEAHRTQYGTLNKLLNKMFSSAFYVAFTGTPRIGKKDTFIKFGDPIDIYFVDDAENDRYVLPIYYKADFDIINLTNRIMGKDKHTYDELMDKILVGELPEDIDVDEIKAEVRKKLMDIRKLIFENETRIKEVTKHIAVHFRNNIEPKGLKGIVIVATRKAAVKYRKWLARELGNDKVFAVITGGNAEDNAEILDYFNELYTLYGGMKSIDEINGGIIESFKKKKNPMLLVVVNKLITGFDEKKLQAIYIDRFMNGYTLLQAVGRCNRKYNKLKNVGIVIDYVGIIDRMKKTLELYFGTRKLQGGNYIFKDVKRLKSRLDNLVADLQKNVFYKFGNLNEYFKRYLKYYTDENSDKIKKDIGFIRVSILSANLQGEFRKLFNDFEGYMNSPVFPELDPKDIDYYTKLYEFLFMIYVGLPSNNKEDELNIDDKKRIALVAFRKILKQIEDDTLIKQFIESERLKLNEISNALKKNVVISLKDLYEKSNGDSDKKLEKTVTTLTILKMNRREYQTLTEKILKKIEEFNLKKINSYEILIKIKPDISKILDLEEVKEKNKFNEEEMYIYNLLDRYNLSDYNLVKLTRSIFDKIKETKKHEDENDFPKILSRNIRIGVLLNLIGKLKDDKIEEVISELKEYYEEVYPECKGLL